MDAHQRVLVHHKAGIEGGLQYLRMEREGERLGQFAWIVWVWVFWDLGVGQDCLGALLRIEGWDGVLSLSFSRMWGGASGSKDYD